MSRPDSPGPLPARGFITGISGFIGRALEPRFRALGCAVRSVDLRADPAREVVAVNVAAAGDWQRHAAQ